MVLLSNVPPIPNEDELARLQASFVDTFQRHFLLSCIGTGINATGLVPPYLQIAQACIASVIASDNPASATTSYALFISGAHLWSVMLEVDNREARLTEAVIAVSIQPHVRSFFVIGALAELTFTR